MMDKITFEKFSVEDACQLLGSTDEINTARLNLTTGPAYSAFLNGKLEACGGIRVRGVGECWAIFSEKATEDNFARKKQIVVNTRSWLDRIIRDERLWRVWSECPEAKPNQNFLEVMKFRKLQAFLRG